MPLSPLDRFLSFRIEWDDESTEYFPIKGLPADLERRSPDHRDHAHRRSNGFMKNARPSLAVPSLLSTSELNFLLNPNHPDFKRIKIGKPIEYRFDSRLLRR